MVCGGWYVIWCEWMHHHAQTISVIDMRVGGGGGGMDVPGNERQR